MTPDLTQQGAAWIVSQFGHLLACRCAGSLQASESVDELRCEACEQRFAIANGILMVADWPMGDDQVRKFQETEQTVRDRQAVFYDACLAINLSCRIELNRMLRVLAETKPKASLDVGCGTGRMSEELAKASERVVAVDRSLSSLRQCHSRLTSKGLAEKVLLIHSDVEHMPIRPGAFDLAATAQVLQHLPSAELRELIVAKMASALRPNGTILASVYEWGGQTWPLQRKEGLHRGGIYYNRFTKQELRELLEPAFAVNSMVSCLGTLLVVEGKRA